MLPGTAGGSLQGHGRCPLWSVTAFLAELRLGLPSTSPAKPSHLLRLGLVPPTLEASCAPPWLDSLPTGHTLPSGPRCPRARVIRCLIVSFGHKVPAVRLWAFFMHTPGPGMDSRPVV